MTDEFAVWTANDSPEWTERNGSPDMLLVHGVGLVTAHTLVQRLTMINPDHPFEIRTITGDAVRTREEHPDPMTNPRIVIDSISPRPAPFRTPRPARRTLGTRGQT